MALARWRERTVAVCFGNGSEQDPANPEQRLQHSQPIGSQCSPSRAAECFASWSSTSLNLHVPGSSADLPFPLEQPVVLRVLWFRHLVHSSLRRQLSGAGLILVFPFLPPLSPFSGVRDNGEDGSGDTDDELRRWVKGYLRWQYHQEAGAATEWPLQVTLALTLNKRLPYSFFGRKCQRVCFVLLHED